MGEYVNTRLGPTENTSPMLTVYSISRRDDILLAKLVITAACIQPLEFFLGNGAGSRLYIIAIAEHILQRAICHFLRK